MSETTIRICQEGDSWQAALIPAGTIIGRGEKCDIVIDSVHISRQHARLFTTADGQWSVEDLGSRNGTFVNGERIESCQISKGDVIEIGPATLSFSLLPEQATRPGIETPNIIVEDFGTEIFYDKPRLEDCERQPCPGQFEQVRRHLSQLADPRTLYSEVCRLLAQEPQTAAAVFRLLSNALPELGTPTLVACHFGSAPGDAKARRTGSTCPSHLAFRISHRLVQAVCEDNRPLMTKSVFSCDTKVTISLIDEHSPRTAMCVPLKTDGNTVDLLYVDVPINDRSGPSTEEIFVFIQAVALLICQDKDSGEVRFAE